MSIMLPSGIDIRIREDLVEGASRVQTTLIIDPIVTLDGHRVVMSDIGDIAYGKIDQGNSREEIISWTGITDNTNSYTLTGVVWGVNFYNLSNAVANYRRHTSGSKFSINTDMHFIAEQYRDLDNNTLLSTDPLDLTTNEIKLGNGTDTLDKQLTAQNGDTNEPFMKYDEGLNKWLISNDGVNTYDPEQGGSGLTAGLGINITAGAIGIDNTDTNIIVNASTGATDASKLPLTNASGLIDSSFVIDSAASTGLEEGANGGTKVKVESGKNILIGASGLAADYGTSANQLLRLDASAKIPAVDGSQLLLATKQITASNTLRFSNNSEATSNSTSLVVLKTITPLISGTWRVSFDYKINIGSATVSITNGSNVTANTGYQTSTQDLTFGSGEKINISCNPSGNTIYIRNFRIYGDLTSTLTYGY